MDQPDLTPEALIAHDRYVRALAKALVFDPSLAEDVAQETWLAALANAPRDRSSLRAWLATIARNLAFKTWRGEDRRARREIGAARPDAVPSAEEIFERETARRSLVEAVLALEDPYRSALILRFFEDLPPRGVARRLGVPVETARTRIKRGLEMLRARLDREHGSTPGAWCLALVQSMRLEPSAHLSPPAAGLEPVALGGLVMAASHKIAAGVAVIAIGLLIFVSSRDRGSRIGTEATGGPVALAPIAAGKQTSAPAVLESPESLARTPSAIPISVPAASSDSRGSLRVHVEWEDGAIASGISARVLPFGDSDFVFRERAARTGDDGEFFLEGLHEGQVNVVLDRGVIATGMIEAGEETLLSVRIEPGFDVEGIVEDIDGLPVPDAEVWLTQLNSLDTGFPVARSGADGRFRVRDVQKRVNGMWMTAIAAWYAPSSAGKVLASVGATVPIRLVLPGRGGELTGTVHGPDGTPVEGAQVHLNPQNFIRSGSRFRGSRDGTEWAPCETLVVRTDANGVFRAPSLPLCDAQLFVRARDLVSWVGEVPIRTIHPEPISIRLKVGATLVGTVVDSTGKPAAGVEMRTIPDQDSGLWQFTHTAADGSYWFRGLEPGRTTVHAGGSGRDGLVRTSLVCEDRGALRWDAELPPVSTGSIRGRVVDEEGRPLVDWRVSVSSSPSTFYGVITDIGPGTDADGRFLIEGLPKAEYSVVAIGPGPVTPHFADATVKRVVPGPDEVLVRVTAATRPSAFIRGRIVDPRGKPVESARITLFLDGHESLSTRGIEEVTDVGTGEFHLGPYVAGRWRLKIDSFGFPTHDVGIPDLRLGQVRDLGTLRLEEGGSIVIHLRRANGGEVGNPFLSLSAGTSWRSIQAPEIEGESVMLGPLPPGSYRLAVLGDSVVLADQSERTARDVFAFEIRPNETARSEWVLRSGIPTVLRFRGPESASQKSEVKIAVFDSTERELLRSRARFDGSGACADKLEYLARGHYRMEAEGPEGLRAVGEFDVGRSDRAPETHEFELLPP